MSHLSRRVTWPLPFHRLAKKNTKYNYQLLAALIKSASKLRHKEKGWHEKSVNKGLTYFTPGVGESSREFMREKRAPRTCGDVIDFVAATMFPENNPQENADREDLTAYLQARAAASAHPTLARARCEPPNAPCPLHRAHPTQATASRPLHPNRMHPLCR